ncbi:Ribonuclease 2-5A [Fragilaria crotonensis]|nr:Ribonuclease 2-5A [Fragilaria crotonensis]
MDRDTGEILRVVTGGDVASSQDEGPDLQGRNIVWVGRVDYSISLFDARSGAMDVKFSSSEIMGVRDMMVDDIEDIRSQPHAPRLMLPTKEEAKKQLAMLIATPNGNVAPGTRTQEVLTGCLTKL